MVKDDDASGPGSLLQSNTSKQSHGDDEGIDLKGGHIPQSEFRSPVASRADSLIRHSGWRTRRQRTWDALLKIGVSGSRLDRFRECGSAHYIQIQASTGEWRLSCNRCRDRWCIPCQADRGRVLAMALADRMTDATCRFVTLTLKHSHMPLADQIDRLYRCFATLRRRPMWMQCVNGGAAFLEIKRGERSGLWHPHLHLIVTGTYIDQRALSKVWYAVTGDSSIVDVRAIADPQGRARYVTKYVTKPADSSVYESTEDLMMMMVVLRGRRLCLTWGTWRDVPLTPQFESEGDWSMLVNVESLARRARDDDRLAYGLWLELIARWPTLKVLFDPLGSG